MPGESGMPPLPSDTGAAMQPSGLPQQETVTVTEGGDVETVTIGGVQPGKTGVIITVGGELQTITVGQTLAPGFPSMPHESGIPMPTDTGAGMQPPLQETVTISQGSVIETVTIGGAQTGQTVVVTMGGVPQTITVGSGYPPMTGKYTIQCKQIEQSLTTFSCSKYVAR